MALFTWTNNIPINGHLNYIKFLVSKLDVTRETPHLCFIYPCFIRFGSVHPSLKDLAVVNSGLSSFGEGDDVVVLVAEAAVAAPESAADDVAGGILPPAFRVPPRHHRRLPPARQPGLFIEGPRAHLRAPAAAAPPAVVPRTGRGRALHSDPVL